MQHSSYASTLVLFLYLVDLISAKALSSTGINSTWPSQHATTIAPECATQSSIPCCTATDEAACWQTACSLPARFAVKVDQSISTADGCWRVRPKSATSAPATAAASSMTSITTPASPSSQASPYAQAETISATTKEADDIDAWAASMNHFIDALRSSMKHRRTMPSASAYSSDAASRSATKTTHASTNASHLSKTSPHPSSTMQHSSSLGPSTTPYSSHSQAHVSRKLRTITTTSSGQPMVLVYEYVDQKSGPNATKASAESPSQIPTFGSESAVPHGNSTSISSSRTSISTSNTTRPFKAEAESVPASPKTIVASVSNLMPEIAPTETSHQEPGTRHGKHRDRTALHTFTNRNTTRTSTITTTIVTTVTSIVDPGSPSSASPNLAQTGISPSSTTSLTSSGSESVTSPQQVAEPTVVSTSTASDARHSSRSPLSPSLSATSLVLPPTASSLVKPPAPSPSIATQLAQLRALKSCRSTVTGAQNAAAARHNATQPRKATTNSAARRFDDDEREVLESAKKVRRDTLAIASTSRYVILLALVAVCAVVVTAVAMGI